MRHFLLLTLVFSALLLDGCKHRDTLFGTWITDTINIEFDESKSTPELVKQFGEMEKNNCIVLSQDSTMRFQGSEEKLPGLFDLRNDTLFYNGQVFGLLKNNRIHTTKKTILGVITVSYKKK